MLTIALVYGVIAGAITIGAIIAGLALGSPDGHLGSQWFGYLVMILALTLIFFGVKRHRDRNLGGVIRFLPALVAGLCIAGVASVVYVAAWETYLAVSGVDFIGQYAEAIIADRQAAGLSDAELQAEIAALQEMQAQYANPLFRLPITFLEIFPVGLIIALVSAALLRNRGFAPART